MKTASFQNKISGVREENQELLLKMNPAKKTKSCPISWAKKELLMNDHAVDIGPESYRDKNSNKSAQAICSWALLVMCEDK